MLKTEKNKKTTRKTNCTIRTPRRDLLLLLLLLLLVAVVVIIIYNTPRDLWRTTTDRIPRGRRRARRPHEIFTSLASAIKLAADEHNYNGYVYLSAALSCLRFLR